MNRTLRRGSRGNDVRELQNALNRIGYNCGRADGIFGGGTEQAVKRFQKDKRLSADGIVGKNTWNMLLNESSTQPTIRMGNRGQAVVELQTKLNQLGYRCGKIDGIFGSGVKHAVMQFQKHCGLSADGIVGKATWQALSNKLSKSSAGSNAQPTIKKGSRGSVVARLQSMLNDLNYNCGAVDGIFGQGVHNAVIQFQRDNGLSADGIVGKNTWNKLAVAEPKKASKEPVYYSQKDVRWRYVMYSNHGDKRQTIGTSGCGTTSMAMVLATWKNSSITPVQTSELAANNGFRTYNSGTSWSYFSWMARKYGLKFKQTSSTDEAVNAIRNGALVVASMGKGYFTKGGHYILLWDVQGGQIIAHDPAKRERDRASISLFKRESKQYFIFYKN